MKATGFYQYTKNGTLKTTKAVFESTGVKMEDNHVIWRKIKDGKPTNVFAEQFQPNMPWAFGKWFIKLNGGTVLEQHPELKVETNTSKAMTDSEYITFLKEAYNG